MSTAATITRKLEDAFQPIRLEVEDQSAAHAGHSGARPGGETHFRVAIVSEKFVGLGRVARQRLVYETLATELAGTVHALALHTLAPNEDR